MQYDVYANPSARSAEAFPYLVDVQSDLLSGLITRLVVPLAIKTLGKSEIPQRLCPIISFAGQDLMLLAYQAAPLPKAQLRKKLGSVREHAAAIVGAIDVVISGI